MRLGLRCRWGAHLYKAVIVFINGKRDDPWLCRHSWLPASRLAGSIGRSEPGSGDCLSTGRGSPYSQLVATRTLEIGQPAYRLGCVNMSPSVSAVAVDARRLLVLTDG